MLYSGYSYHDKPMYPDEWIGNDYYLLRLQTEGNCRICLDGRSERLVPGDLLFLRPEETYRLVVEENEEGKAGSGDYYVICKGAWIDRWASRGDKPKRAHIQADGSVLDIWKRIVLERRRIGENNGELVDYLLRALCLTLERAFKQANGGKSDNVRGVAAHRMKRYIEEHATQTFAVDEVAASVRLSPSRAAKLFKEAFGETIVKYAIRVRLSIAIERMQYSGLTLEQIAESCGFGSYPYFYRCFMKRFGVSPREYREEASPIA